MTNGLLTIPVLATWRVIDLLARLAVRCSEQGSTDPLLTPTTAGRPTPRPFGNAPAARVPAQERRTPAVARRELLHTAR